MAHCVHHATNLWAIFFDDNIANSLKSKRTKGVALFWTSANF
jgi:hypothetical protein